MNRNIPDKYDEEYKRFAKALNNENQNQNQNQNAQDCEKLNEYNDTFVSIKENKKNKNHIIQNEGPELPNLLQQFNSSTGPTLATTKNTKNNSSKINTASTQINNSKSKNISDEVDLDDSLLSDNLFNLEKDSDKVDKIKQKMSKRYDILEDIPFFDIFDYSQIPDSVMEEMKEKSLKKITIEKNRIFLGNKRKKYNKKYNK